MADYGGSYDQYSGGGSEARGGQGEGYKLFVGNLSFRTEGPGLRNAFERFGRIVDSVVVENRETGQSRGFGFVTYETKEQADEAITNMDNTELDGRIIKVNFARPREDFGGRRGGGGYGGGGRGGGGYGGGGYNQGGGGYGGGGGYQGGGGYGGGGYGGQGGYGGSGGGDYQRY